MKVCGGNIFSIQLQKESLRYRIFFYIALSRERKVKDETLIHKSEYTKLENFWLCLLMYASNVQT